MAALCGLALTTVQRIWRSHHLRPHRVRSSERSNGPQFAARLDGVVGLQSACTWRRRATRSCCRSTTRASSKRSTAREPGLPLERGKCATSTFDYERNGTTTLFAAPNTSEGTAFGRCTPRHRHQEIIAFLDQIEDAVLAGQVIHGIMDNDANHERPEVLAWPADNPRWTVSFRPSSCSGLEAVESSSPG